MVNYHYEFARYYGMNINEDRLVWRLKLFYWFLIVVL